jgi:response regulator RpfG family c-di-GMP phosphodiesterase
MAPDPSSARILVVDDEEDILVAARLLLKRQFASVKRFLTRPACLISRDRGRSTFCCSI